MAKKEDLLIFLLCLMTSLDFQDKHGKKGELIPARHSLNSVFMQNTCTCTHVHTHTNTYTNAHIQTHTTIKLKLFLSCEKSFIMLWAGVLINYLVLNCQNAAISGEQIQKYRVKIFILN